MSVFQYLIGNTDWSVEYLQNIKLIAPKAGSVPMTVVEPAPIKVLPPPPSSARTSPAGTIEMDINGVRIRLRGAVDEASLRMVLRALAAIA